MIENEKAILVDIRYPTDFAAAHIDGAINLSLRRMPTEAMNEHIAKLPKRPIIMPCYDRRGCFFSEVLGYELTKAGHEVRGRYTLPWEYFVARARPPHVEAWIAENNKGLWARSPLIISLARCLPVSQWTGVLAAIVLLALHLAPARPAVLAQGRARPDSCPRGGGRAGMRMKSRLKDDPVRKTHAHPRLLQAARHHAGAQSAGAGVPAGDGGGADGGAGTGYADERGLPVDCRPRPSRSVVHSAADLRRADHALSSTLPLRLTQSAER